MVTKGKILVVGQKGSVFCPPAIKAFEELGYECLFFDHRTGPAYNSLILKRLFRLLPVLTFIKDITIRQINKNLLATVGQFKPDILFVSVGENISPETITLIKSRGVKTANWFTDFISHWHIIKKLAPVYDYFFCPDPPVLEKIKSLNLTNCFHLPLAIEKVFETPPAYRKEYDIGFVGSYEPTVWKMREPFLASVKDLGLNIWGPPVWQNTLLKDNYRGRASGQKMLDIYAKSKIVIDIPWDNFYAESISVRPFEVMSVGTCLLFYNIRKDMDRVFKDGVEYVSFTNKEELRTKVEFYLTHDQEREDIARNGFNAITGKHTYLTRMQQVLDTMK